MAYGSVTGVARVNSHLTGGYSGTSLPTASAVAEWLEQGTAAINVALAKAGYTTPVSDSAAVYPYIVRLCNLWAAAVAEQSTNQALGETETRSEKLWQQYKDELAELLDGDLTLVGLTQSTATPVNAGMRSREMRRRDGWAKRFDPHNSEYATGDSDDDITLREPWRLSGTGGKPEGNY